MRLPPEDCSSPASTQPVAPSGSASRRHRAARLGNGLRDPRRRAHKALCSGVAGRMQFPIASTKRVTAKHGHALAGEEVLWTRSLNNAAWVADCLR